MFFLVFAFSDKRTTVVSQTITWRQKTQRAFCPLMSLKQVCDCNTTTFMVKCTVPLLSANRTFQDTYAQTCRKIYSWHSQRLQNLSIHKMMSFAISLAIFVNWIALICVQGYNVISFSCISFAPLTTQTDSLVHYSVFVCNCYKI